MERAKKSGRAATVTPEKYGVMFAAFCEKQTVEFVAKKCGVHWQTAQKYIERGDPARGLAPLAERYREAQAKAQEQENEATTEAIVDSLSMVRELKQKLLERVQELEPGEIPGKDLPGAVDKLLRLENFLEGGPDSRTGTEGAEPRALYLMLARLKAAQLVSMTPEEIKAEGLSLDDDSSALEQALLDAVPDKARNELLEQAGELRAEALAKLTPEQMEALAGAYAGGTE